MLNARIVIKNIGGKVHQLRERDGKWTFWDENGQKSIEGTYKDETMIDKKEYPRK